MRVQEVKCSNREIDTDSFTDTEVHISYIGRERYSD